MWARRYLAPEDADRLELIAECAAAERSGPSRDDALRIAEFVRSESGLVRLCRDVEVDRGRRS